jgi:eukaryotic-like serine/threonine-protein kinase
VACPLDGTTLVSIPDPLVGRTIGGRYVLERKIGAGGMSTVYLARHELVGRDVAVKFLAPELAVDESYRTRFLREARAANRINHENIIDITDLGETDDGLVYLVMEHLEGTLLAEAIRRGPLPLPRALRIGLQMAWALGRAHELDVIHRDIKPDNVFLLPSHGGDFVKILDFGLAHVKGELRLTASGTVFGTPEYMAPEQARGMRMTAATDLYSLGCVLFEMITGRLPFDGPTTTLILKHMREEPPRVASLVPTVPDAVDSLVAHLLVKDPEARLANAYQLAERLGGLLSQQTGLSNPPPPAELVGRSPRLSGMRLNDRTVSAEDMWDDRIGRLAQAAARAHPEGPPDWLSEALERLAHMAVDMRRLRQERDRRLAEVSQWEQDLAETRRRIGCALDELARDEALVTSQIRVAEEPFDEARGRLAAAEAQMLERWRALGPPPTSPTQEDVARARGLGEAATVWCEARPAVEAIERMLEPWHRQREDLRFQITQLKGRLGSMSAEGEFDLEGAKGEADAVDRQLASLVAEVAQEAEPAMRHLLAFPEQRAWILGDPVANVTQTSDGRTSSRDS